MSPLYAIGVIALFFVACKIITIRLDLLEKRRLEKRRFDANVKAHLAHLANQHLIAADNAAVQLRAAKLWAFDQELKRQKERENELALAEVRKILGEELPEGVKG